MSCFVCLSQNDLAFNHHREERPTSPPRPLAPSPIRKPAMLSGAASSSTRAARRLDQTRSSGLVSVNFAAKLRTETVLHYVSIRLTDRSKHLLQPALRMTSLDANAVTNGSLSAGLHRAVDIQTFVQVFSGNQRAYIKVVEAITVTNRTHFVRNSTLPSTSQNNTKPFLSKHLTATYPNIPLP